MDLMETWNLANIKGAKLHPLQTLPLTLQHWGKNHRPHLTDDKIGPESYNDWPRPHS